MKNTKKNIKIKMKEVKNKKILNAQKTLIKTQKL
jgi:hypothetical protein